MKLRFILPIKNPNDELFGFSLNETTLFYPLLKEHGYTH